MTGTSKATVIGMRRLKRKLKRLPEHLTEGVRRANQDGVNLTTRAIAAEAPERTGKLKMSVSFKISKDKLSWKAGFFKKGNKRAYDLAGYRAGWVIFGTKGGTVKKGPAKGAVIPPQPPNPFIQRAWARVKPTVQYRINTEINKALKSAGNL